VAEPVSKKVEKMDLPFEIEFEAIIKQLRLKIMSSRIEESIRQTVEQARQVARPKAVFLLSSVRHIDQDSVEIDGIRFTSRALSKNLSNLHTVVPNISTIGTELDELTEPFGDVWRQYCLDIVKNLVLMTSMQHLNEFLKKKYDIPNSSSLNPGEFEDFPITEQKPLFALFGGVEREIGVSLTPGGAIKPIKSRSGIMFSNDTGFVSCLLCTQDKCPGRRAAYNPKLVEEFQIKVSRR
jgi:hypothetical protein